jgi:hypothetical protein
MAEQNENIIAQFLANANAAPKDEFLKRRKAKADRITTRADNLLGMIIAARREAHEDFWGDSDKVSPRAVANGEWGPGKTASVFEEDSALVAFLAGRLKKAGATDQQISDLLPGVRDGYTVVPVEGGLVIEDKIE